MDVECVDTAEFLELLWKFPLSAIEDDRTYRAAIEILDRLFALDDHRTAAEMEYFQELASIASEYEAARLFRKPRPLLKVFRCFS